MTAHSKPVKPAFPTLLLMLYITQLNTHPLKTKAITSGVLLGLQEFLAQVLSATRSKRKGKSKQNEQYLNLDNRIIKMALYGFFINGPMNYVLFELLNKSFRDRSKWLKFIASLLIIVPIQNAVLLAATALINGEQAVVSVKRSIYPTLKSAWMGTVLTTVFAQKALSPPYWDPFFSLVGFSFGLYANTCQKIAQRQKEPNSG
ncbi:4657_t:CDS:2 [Acaulospora morrowiae]|uniref:4657_t:CDS:1 n=1 Tax=Acaulospora morrowiae TaxID=94023 RepID=A0A9N9BFL5_9GLOM|nr:4657_t:CDS:2 [Acaulospora morrowiae]